MVVLNAENGHVVTDAANRSGTDAAAFDPETGYAFSSNGEGTVTVVHEDSPDKYSVVENVATQRGARTMTLDPKTHRLFSVTAEFGPTPAPTAERPRPRPPMGAGYFHVAGSGEVGAVWHRKLGGGQGPPSRPERLRRLSAGLT